MVGTSLHSFLSDRAGVEADRGCGGEVEALGVGVEGDAEGVVEKRAHLVRETVGFAAEDPGDRFGQVGGVERVVGVPVRTNKAKARGAARGERRADVTRSSDG